MSEPRPRAGRKRVLARVLVALVVGLLTVEACVRALVWYEVPYTRRLRERLRNPANFAPSVTDEYWKLRFLFADRDRHRPPQAYHPELGWISGRIDRDTFEHRDAARLRGRRPILLYGDSFTACETSAADCWEGLLERTELGERFAILNYGTGGYGLDQMLMLMRRSLDRYAALDPLVLVGILVDDDLDRTLLSFRGWPKPRYTLEDGELVAHTELRRDPAEFLAENPPRIASYAWRWLVNGTTLVPRSQRLRWSGTLAAFGEARGLSRSILEAMKQETSSRSLDLAVIVFHGKGWLDSRPPRSWREPFLVAELDRLAIPWALSRTPLEQASGEVRDYFFLGGRHGGHLTPLGNEVVFEALADLIRSQEGH